MGNIESEKWKRQEILNSDWRDDDFYYLILRILKYDKKIKSILS